MELEIVELAKRMRDDFYRFRFRKTMLWTDAAKEYPWKDEELEYRLAWVAAAAVARPDLVAGLSVEEGHWLYPLFPQRSHCSQCGDDGSEGFHACQAFIGDEP